MDPIVPRFCAEPPQLPLPEGDWEQQLTQEFLSACLGIRSDGLGEPGEVVFYPDRTWCGRSYLPATCSTDRGRELFGLISFQPALEDGEEPSGFATSADWTEETPDTNPEWTIDICDEVIGGWRGENGAVAAMTVVWGRPLGDAAASVATAELGGVTVDRCLIVDGRFTLLAPDDYGDETLEIAVYGDDGAELARESLYAEDEDVALMDVESAIRTRRTHKVYAAEPVDRATLDALFDLARWAPNHHLTNPWRFRVVGPQTLAALKQAAGPEAAPKLDRAPTLVGVTTIRSGDPVQDREDLCATAAAAYIVLLAGHARGLATYWRTPGFLRTDAGRRALGVGDDEDVLGLLYLGHARQEQQPPERAPVADVVTYLA